MRSKRDSLPGETGPGASDALAALNDTDRPLPAHGLARLFQDQVRRAPDRVAVIDETRQVTYGELNRRANRLARRLQQLGVGDGTLVAISMPRSMEMIVGVLAIMKAGGAYVPLDPDYPQTRLDFMLADTGAPVVITTAQTGVRFAGSNAHVLQSGEPDGFPASLPDSDPELSSTPDSLAYVLYTSGSTGQPKGVMIPQRAVVRLVINTDYVQVRPHDRVAHASNSSFDAATFEIWGALLNGATLVIVARDTLLSPASLRQEIVRTGITTLFLTTALFNEYGNSAPGLFAGLTHLLFGGEVVDPKAIQRILKTAPPARLINGYGPTETTTFALWHEIRSNAGLFDETRPVPIGRPLANTRVHILDGNLQPVPVGSEGEIHIEGPGLAEGYLHQPELTAERFITLAVSDGNVRLYRTGDMGRWSPQGFVEYLGRRDQQIKLRGFRIEPDEIEATLRQCPGVKEGVVLVHEHPPGNRFLHAYVSPEGSAALEVQVVRQFVAGQLPAHMIPARFSIVAQMPLTANGKINRQELRLLSRTDQRQPEVTDAPVSPLARQLVDIWSDVLSLPAKQIDSQADFFELGGNSLMAVQIGNRLSSLLGQHMSVRELLELGSIERVAAALGKTRSPERSEPDLRGLAAPLRYPATASQQQVAFFSMLVPGTRAYLTQSMFTFVGKLDVGVLRQSIQDVVDRHEHLRTTYCLDDTGQLQGEVAASLRISLPVEDLRHLPQAAREQAVDAMVNKMLDTGIDPSELPLARWSGFQLQDDEFRMLMIEHHYVHDGWSFRHFLKELSLCYTARADGCQPGLAPATQFRLYAAWQRHWLASPAASSLLGQWVQYLQGCGQVLRLPMAKAQTGKPTLSGGQLRVHLAAEELERVSARAAGMRLTLFQFMFGAFALLLERYTGRSEFLLGTSAANRDSATWESVLGMLVNVIPVRIRLDTASDVDKSLHAVADSLQWAVERAAMPFSTIVETIQPVRAPGQLPLVQVHFSSHNALSRNLTFGDLDWNVVEALPNGTAKFDLGVISIPYGRTGGLDLLFEYNDGLFDRDAVEAIAADYRALLQEEPREARGMSIARRSGASAAVDTMPAAATIAEHRAPWAPPVSAVEQQLASVWAEILDVERPGIDDNFFALGGHSLLAARMALRINALSGVELPLSTLFSAPTIRELARHLEVQVGLPEPTGESFINVIRPSAGQGTVICVGGHVIQSLSLLPRSIGILYAGSSAMDPVEFHRSGVKRAVTRYVEGIRQLNLQGPLVVVGFSYGGLVAYALVERLQSILKTPVMAVLLEPSIPDFSRQTIRYRLHHAAKLVKRGMTGVARRAKRLLAGGLPAPAPLPACAPVQLSERDRLAREDPQWQRISPVLHHNIARYRPAGIVASGVHVIAGNDWSDKFLADFARRFAAAAQVHPQGSITHHDVVENDVCVAAWRKLIIHLLECRS